MANLQSTRITQGTIVLPKGTTAQRPGTPEIGSIRFNTTLGYTELYNGASWEKVIVDRSTRNIGTVQTTSGTAETYWSETDLVHAFLSGTHTFTPRYDGFVEVLVVAGGGGGGGWGGGGGAGGLIYRSAFPVVSNTN
jgi:hypothetical protein